LNLIRLAEHPLLSALLCLAAVAAALVSQHAFDMQPCPWCVLQRLIFVALAAVALCEAAPLWRQNPSTTASVAGGALAAIRTVLALSGLAAALWQHFVAAASASCNLTWADRILAATQLDALLPDIFQPRASCLEAKTWLLGIPYEFWSAALFVALAALAVRSAAAQFKGRRSEAH
jgi:disulfide bond formation protein DsbB